MTTIFGRSDDSGLDLEKNPSGGPFHSMNMNYEAVGFFHISVIIHWRLNRREVVAFEN